MAGGASLRSFITSEPVLLYPSSTELADFGGPHARLKAAGLISEESNPWQYRFLDIVEPDTGKALFRVEHEVRSMTHPLYARPLVNRNAGINNRNYMPGHEAWACAMPPGPA